jgi:hypothetical protein
MRVLGVVAVVVVALLSAGYWMLASLTQVERADAARATAVLRELRARFDGVTPAFEIRDGRAVMVRRPPDANASQAASTHAVAWRPSKGTLSRATFPLWVLGATTEPVPLDRLVALLETDLRVDGLQLRVRDIQRYGRTLLLDGVTPEGDEVLIWSE